MLFDSLWAGLLASSSSRLNNERSTTWDSSRLESNSRFVASKLNRSNASAIDFARHLHSSHGVAGTSLFSSVLCLEKIARRASAHSAASDVRNDLGTTVLSAGTNNVTSVAARLWESFDETGNLEWSTSQSVKSSGAESLLTMQGGWPGKSCAATRPAAARRAVVNFMMVMKRRDWYRGIFEQR